MTTLTAEQFERLIPLACEWAEGQERLILTQGVRLNEEQLADARRIGIAKPESVRLLSVPAIPMPTEPVLVAAAEATQLISPFTIGLTLRYGIFIHADHWGDRRLVAHELVHTMQYERLGSVDAFLLQYLFECLTIGYPEAPMEQEAIRIEQEIGG